MKNKALGYSALGIALIALSVILFAIPIVKTTAFWVTYGFTLLSFGMQIVIWKVAFGRENTLKSKFLGFPLLHIGIVYLVLQIIALIVFAVIPELPTWLSVIVCVFLMGVSSIGLIAAETGHNEIDRVGKAVGKKVFYIQSLQADVEMLAAAESDLEVKRTLNQLAEKIRFSDPMSADELQDIEYRMVSKVEELKNSTEKSAIILELNQLLIERNKKCKFLK